MLARRVAVTHAIIEVKFKDQGLTSIEVIDDGTGINKLDYPSIARKHHTSKISKLSDLTSVQTFGFRGEALASLCAMCEKVTITTATAEEAPMGTVLVFARSGEVESSSKKTARQVRLLHSYAERRLMCLVSEERQSSSKSSLRLSQSADANSSE